MRYNNIEERKHYANVHYWIKSRYGKANECENENCKGESIMYDWAKKDGCEYEKKRESFIMLCRSCHVRYDFTEERRRKLLGAKASDETRRKMAKRKADNAGHVKLTWDIVNDVRLRYLNGEKQVAIAKIYDLPKTYIWSLVRNQYWYDENYDFKKGKHYYKSK